MTNIYFWFNVETKTVRLQDQTKRQKKLKQRERELISPPDCYPALVTQELALLQHKTAPDTLQGQLRPGKILMDLSFQILSYIIAD